jgi:1,4-alpha-glucan branching enzyme
MTAFVARRDADGAYRITYVVTHASSVEISGDFNRWHPIALRQTREGVWETSLPLTPGTYRVNVRVDGGRWLPPAGLPQADDDFSGAVGVLIVR